MYSRRRYDSAISAWKVCKDASKQSCVLGSTPPTVTQISAPARQWHHRWAHGQFTVSSRPRSSSAASTQPIALLARPATCDRRYERMSLHQGVHKPRPALCTMRPASNTYGPSARSLIHVTFQESRILRRLPGFQKLQAP